MGGAVGVVTAGVVAVVWVEVEVGVVIDNSWMFTFVQFCK
jgi:hypothetical protein